MADPIDFLTALHSISVRSHENVEILDTLINDTDLPPMLKTLFMEIQTTLRLQDVIIRRMGEQQVEVNDRLDDLLTRLGSPKKD